MGPEKRGSGYAAKGSTEAGGKKGAYKPTMRAGWDNVSSDSGARRRATRGTGSTGGDLAAGSPKGGSGGVVEKPVFPEEVAVGNALKRRSRRSPEAKYRRRRKKKSARTLTLTSDEESSGKEGSDSDDEEVTDEESEEDDGQLRFGMEPLQRRMGVEGSAAWVFAQRLTREREGSSLANQDFLRALADILSGSEEPDPDEIILGACEARPYVVVMNNDHRFTLVHHVARLDHELRPSNPILNRIVAFGDDVRPDATCPNVWVFDGRDEELFARVDLPDVNIQETLRFYSDEENGNDACSSFELNPTAVGLGRSRATPMIPIPMEWAALFLDNPTFGVAIRRMFDLFDSLDTDAQVQRMPILAMMATACCGSDNSGEAKSALASEWTQLRFHRGTRVWAEETWRTYLPPTAGRDGSGQGPVPPEDRVKNLFGSRPRRPGVTIPRAPATPPARGHGHDRELGDTLVRVIEAQAKANLALHESFRTDLRENIRLTGAAVVASGGSKDSRLTESKLRILRACSGEDDGQPFTPSKFYVEVEREGCNKDTVGRILRRMAVTVPGSAHKCNIHVTPKIVEAVKSLNFSSNDDRTFVGCTGGITPFAVPWRTEDAVNSDIAEERYFDEATLKSPADI